MSIRKFISEIIRDGRLIHQNNQTAVEHYYSTALRLLNGIIKGLNLEKDNVVYRTSYTFNFVPDQTLYNVNFVQIDLIYFLLSGSIRLILERQGLTTFIQKSPIVSASGPPSIFHAEPKPDFTMDITLYLPPSQADSCIIWGKQAIQEFTLVDTYPATLAAYANYLKWKTIEQMRTAYDLPEDRRYGEYAEREKNNLKQTKDLDLAVKMSGLGRRGESPFGAILFNKGFSP